MNSFSFSIEDNKLILDGTINIDSVGKVLTNFNKHSALYIDKQVSEVDCRQIHHADSSCLAFLLHLQTVYNDLVYVGLPAHLLLLIELYGLKKLINLK